MFVVDYDMTCCVCARTISKDDVQSLESTGNQLHVVPDTKYYMGIQRQQSNSSAQHTVRRF